MSKEEQEVRVIMSDILVSFLTKHIGDRDPAS